MEIAIYGLALISTLFVIWRGGFPTSLSKTYYSVGPTFFENYTWIMSTLLWINVVYSSNVYDNFLRPEYQLYEGEGWWWMWNMFAAISFMGIGIYGRYEHAQRFRHFLHAGLALVFAAIDVGAFYTYTYFPGEHFLGIVGGTVAAFFLGKKLQPTHKIMWAELFVITYICLRNIIVTI